jgi:hypothetical protein
VDISVPWPKFLRDMMVWLSSLNLNVDLGTPLAFIDCLTLLSLLPTAVPQLPSLAYFSHHDAAYLPGWDPTNQTVKAECSYSFSAVDKMKLTLAMRKTHSDNVMSYYAVLCCAVP